MDRRRIAMAFPAVLLAAWLLVEGPEAAAPPPTVAAAEKPIADRSPIDLVLSPDEKWLVTANHTSASVCLIRVEDGKVMAEVAASERPSGLAWHADGKRVLLVTRFSGELIEYTLSGETLAHGRTLRLGYQPFAVAIHPDGKRAYVTLSANSQVAVVDLEKFEQQATIAVSPWPRSLAITPNGKRLAVLCSGDRSVNVVDTETNQVAYDESFRGINAGQAFIPADGKHVYFPWMVYRHNPINERNIRLGWVLGSRIGRVRLDGPETREAMTLDVRGEAVADPTGMGITGDGEWLVCSAPGTHELLLYRMYACKFESVGGPGDHIEPSLLQGGRFVRIPLGGRPMNLRISKDNRRVFVANYLHNSVQVVDLAERDLVQTIALPGPAETSLARRGEAYFFDGGRSLDQWYSCNSCHWEGGTNAVPMDTLNDGSERTFKTVLPLYNVTHTGPWTWHGWQQDLHAAMKKSTVQTMLGKPPTDDDVQAILAYLSQMPVPPNPNRQPDGSLTAAAKRGKLLFESDRAGCYHCHAGPYFTDGEIHDVGLNSPSDKYQGYNTPSLIGVYSRVRLTHKGSAKSFEQLLTEYHKPHELGEGPELNEAERKDLIEYLKSL